ncbi:MAG: tyrosine-type recombinase/integrase, partial [Myxococcales bacterium]
PRPALRLRPDRGGLPRVARGQGLGPRCGPPAVGVSVHEAVTEPKGGRSRRIPLTGRLTKALRVHGHLRGPRVVCQDDGKPLTQKVVQGLVQRAARKAGLTDSGVHLLRHTFCSHLAMRGATAKAIQELAGHRDLTTTQIYMHLSPAALEDAIRLLDGDGHGANRGEIVEAAGTENPSR